jgi:deoxyribodipyrimidine photo-lyase
VTGFGAFDDLAKGPRVTVRRGGAPDADGLSVVYWMQRAQRAADNPALDAAIEIGNRLGKPVVAFFGLHPFVERANLRHYHFLAEGLAAIEEGLRRRGVAFALRPHPDHRIAAFAEEVRAAIVIGDENPLRQQESWRARAASALRVPLWTVDADVIVPSKLLEKEHYAARTIRPRILARLEEFLAPARETAAHAPWPRRRLPMSQPATIDVLRGLPVDRSAGPVSGFPGGTAEGRRRLRRLLRTRLAAYAEERSHPESAGTSELSPYLHFGHIGPREVARAVRDSGGAPETVAAFLDQLVIRRELAVNFVRFNESYDRLAGCERWARETLARHRRDPRRYRYSAAALEAGDTHDPLWNAGQRQMRERGWMHGYVRMYWAKKILEWSPSAERAFGVAIALNDRYQLDGRDPNGYANIAWALGGKHDRPWPERAVFGTIRSMTFESTSRKFDAARYISGESTSAGG